MGITSVKWTDEEVKSLYDIVSKYPKEKQLEGFRKAAKILKKTVASCSTKFSRVDWNSFTTGEKQNCSAATKPWKDVESLKLFKMRQIENKSYIDIGKILSRTPSACQRQFQRMGPDGLIIGKEVDDKSVENALAKAEEIEEDALLVAEKEHGTNLSLQVVDWLVGTAKADPDILKAMDEAAFDAKLDRLTGFPDARFTKEEVTMPFAEIKKLAMDQIESLGMAYPKNRILSKGTYVVVGDSHGKHTANGMFDLLQTINKAIKPTNIIHIGHISDDEGDISFRWCDFPNLIVVGVLSELKLLKEQKHPYDVVKNEIKLGSLSVRNQYDSGDFVKKSVGRIDSATVPDMTVVNTHRHELHSHCGYNKSKMIMSPGCTCERHTIRTVKQLIFKNGYPTIRQVSPVGFHKYNKQEQDNTRWENGLIIVEVDDAGNFSVSHCRVRKTSLGYTTSFFDHIYGEKGIQKPEKKLFFNGDMHCSFHDVNILDIQEQFCQNYLPDAHINVGDLMDNRGVNHHMGGTSGAAFFYGPDGVEYKKFIPEVMTARWVMLRMRQWAKESYLVVGNHERFIYDFSVKHPQLQDLFQIPFLLGTNEMDIKVTNLHKTLDFGYARFIHGDQKVWGGSGGSKVDKVANNYGDNTVMGNIHYPCIRSGCYSVPMTGQLDQYYNEVDASQWMQGFGYANVFENECFVSLVMIMQNQCILAGKTYSPRDCSSWAVPNWKMNLNSEFDRQSEVNQSVNQPKHTRKASGCPIKTVLMTKKPSKKAKGKTPKTSK
jgi:hypothetical protein